MASSGAATVGPEWDDSSGEAEAMLVEALRRGDEAAFSEVFRRHNATLLRVAGRFAPSRAVAEEIVQDTWLGVVRGIEGFEARSSLKTWIFRILVNVARTKAHREARSIPFSSTGSDDGDRAGLDPDRFFSPDHDRWPGHWRIGPARWALPEERLLAGELQAEILAAIDALPDTQREVIALRDIGGWSSSEVCNALGVSAVNQRVLLHRARTSVRASVEDLLGATEETA